MELLARAQPRKAQSGSCRGFYEKTMTKKGRSVHMFSHSCRRLERERAESSGLGRRGRRPASISYDLTQTRKPGDHWSMSNRVWLDFAPLYHRRRNALAFQKTKKLKKMVLAMGFRGMLDALKPGTCRAQAEIDPDRYETPNADVPTANILKTAPPGASVSRDSSRGRFVHPRHS